jgi:hypothetical protein
MKPRIAQADAELRQATQDVNYEIYMLFESASYVGAVWGSPLHTLSNEQATMALESFLLHFRNLRAFLCPSLQKAPPRPDDILGSDFLHKPDPEDVADPNNIGDDKERLDQMLAHLTYNRRKVYIASGNITWNVGKMAVAMLQELEDFLTRIPHRMKPWFIDHTVIAERKTWIQEWSGPARAFAHTMGPVRDVRPSKP